MVGHLTFTTIKNQTCCVISAAFKCASYSRVFCPGSHQPVSVAQSDARPTGGQKVAGLIPAGFCSILSRRLIINAQADILVNCLED